MTNGRSGALKPDRFGLSYKANKFSDPETGNLGVLTTHKHYLVSLLVMPAQPASSTSKEGMRSGRSGALKLVKLGFSCKANKYSDAGTADLGVPIQHASGECRHKHNRFYEGEGEVSLSE